MYHIHRSVLGIVVPCLTLVNSLEKYSVSFRHVDVDVMLSVQPGFLGGRLAIRRALVGTEAGSVPPLAILHNQDGAPVLPEGLAASISHKRHMAVALVQPGCEGNIGMVGPVECLISRIS